ncbi:MAG TPA: FixH family protein [Candidatus Sphingobacterium stercorigallinarum]|nr:FixH family protein [Candidatus Sphingobacterium stercorigallinarum]
MSWGYKIIIGLGAFMLFILSAGVYMVTQDSDELIESDYYEKSLHYDEIYMKHQQMLTDKASPVVALINDTLLIDFKHKKNEGVLRFMRADNKELDRSVPFATSNYHFSLPIGTFKDGKWNLIIDWKSEKTSYQLEEILYKD